MYYVYQLRRSDSTLPFYIGKGIGGRNLHHFFPSEIRKRSLKALEMRKASREGIEVLSEIIFEDLTEDEAFRIEMELIAKHGRRDIGTGFLCNMTIGGEGGSGRVVSTDTKKKLSASHLGKPKTEEAKMKMRKPKSPEARKAMSDAAKLRKISPEQREKMAEAQRNRYRLKGVSPLKGKPLSQEHIAKIKTGHRYAKDKV